MSEKSCFFSGHRIIAAKKLPDIVSRLREEILDKINGGVKVFIAGGALGFDTVAAEQVIDMRSDYDMIKLKLYLPCYNQCKHWKAQDKERFEKIRDAADEVVYITEGDYTNGCMKKRNQAMVEAADCGIVYVTRNINSGSGQTLKMAKKIPISIINIADII